MNFKTLSIILLAALLTSCGRVPLSALTNVQELYPDAKITLIRRELSFQGAPSQWLVQTKDASIIVWSADNGKIVEEQVILNTDNLEL